MTEDAAATALVLSGGGAYGAFEVGVMKVLFAGRSPASGYEPLAANILTGASGGAFNAALITGRRENSYLEAVLRLESVWLNQIGSRSGKTGNGVFRLVGDLPDYLDPSYLRSPDVALANFASDGSVIGRYFLGRTANFLASSLPIRDRLIDFVNIGSFIDTSPFQQLLEKLVNEQAIRESENHLSVIATDWVTGSPVHFCNSDFREGLGIRAIGAAAAIPGIFPPVRIGADIFVDGGVADNTPLKPALKLGATELHVIYLDPQPRYIPIPGEPNTLNTFLRAYNLMLATKLNEDIETAKWINAGLRAMAALNQSGELSQVQLRDVTRVAGKLFETDAHYRPITIHRYFPRASLGGDLGMLNFRVDSIQGMIEEGERVALLHDCVENSCLLTDASAA
jgi:predicted acylesterase/phospholipase RssA